MMLKHTTRHLKVSVPQSYKILQGYKILKVAMAYSAQAVSWGRLNFIYFATLSSHLVERMLDGNYYSSPRHPAVTPRDALACLCPPETHWASAKVFRVFLLKKNAKKVADVEMQCNALINCLISSSQQFTWLWPAFSVTQVSRYNAKNISDFLLLVELVNINLIF